VFVGLDRQRIPPQMIRDYKLNMLGQRAKAISQEVGSRAVSPHVRER